MKNPRDTGVKDGTAVDGHPKRAKKIDTGKLLALHKAGWRNVKIAEELGVSDVTVGNYLRKMKEKQNDGHKTNG